MPPQPSRDERNRRLAAALRRLASQLDPSPSRRDCGTQTAVQGCHSDRLALELLNGSFEEIAARKQQQQPPKSTGVVSAGVEAPLPPITRSVRKPVQVIPARIRTAPQLSTPRARRPRAQLAGTPRVIQSVKADKGEPIVERRGDNFVIVLRPPSHQLCRKSSRRG